MTISEKVAYLKGLAEGLDLDTQKSKEGKLISVMIGILEEISLSIEDLEENTLALGEEIDVLSDDLADVEEVVFEDDEDEDEASILAWRIPQTVYGVTKSRTQLSNFSLSLVAQW